MWYYFQFILTTVGLPELTFFFGTSYSAASFILSRECGYLHMALTTPVNRWADCLPQPLMDW
jgi:hypothetical protein